MHSDDLRTTPQAARFDRISKLFHNIVYMGVESDHRCYVVMAWLHELRERIDKSVCDSNDLVDTQSVAKPRDDD